jgi:Holliday junction DNA helicase RuvA
MISAITGELIRVDDDRVQLCIGPIVCELLVPAADRNELQESMGQELTFHTLLYIEGDPNRGNLEPRVLGFLRREDKKFFELFTTVKGIGPKTALRALSAPVGQIAQAIESKDTRFLVGLDGIGKRTAELIVAELSGKAKLFATGIGEKPGHTPSRHSQVEEDAIAAIIQLGERRTDAETLLHRVRQADPNLKTTDAILREMLRLRTARV